jgi:hypothetical protein
VVEPRTYETKNLLKLCIGFSITLSDRKEKVNNTIKGTILKGNSGIGMCNFPAILKNKSGTNI